MLVWECEDCAVLECGECAGVAVWSVLVWGVC